MIDLDQSCSNCYLSDQFHWFVLNLQFNTNQY